jgi:hypothetical protein
MLVHTGADDKKITFLEASPDTQKVKAPQTDKMSDKNRVAMSKQPQLNREELKKLLDATRAGRPGQQPTPAPQQAPPPAAAQGAPPEQQPKPTPPPPQVARLQTPPVTRKPTFDTQPMSASQTIAQAAQAAWSDGNHHQHTQGVRLTTVLRREELVRHHSGLPRVRTPRKAASVSNDFAIPKTARSWDCVTSTAPRDVAPGPLPMEALHINPFRRRIWRPISGAAFHLPL